MRSVGVKPERQPARATPAVGADAGERSLTRAMGVVAEFEAASVRLYNSGLKRVRTRTLPPWAFADLIETQIAKPWDEQVHVRAALPGSLLSGMVASAGRFRSSARVSHIVPGARSQ